MAVEYQFISSIKLILPPNFDRDNFIMFIQMISNNYAAMTYVIDKSGIYFTFHNSDGTTENLTLFYKILEILPNFENIQIIERCKYPIERGLTLSSSGIDTFYNLKFQGYDIQKINQKYRIFLKVKKMEYAPYTIQLLRALIQAGSSIVLYSASFGDKWSLTIHLQNSDKMQLISDLNNVFEMLRNESTINIELRLCNRRQLEKVSEDLEIGNTKTYVHLRELKNLILQFPELVIDA